MRISLPIIFFVALLGILFFPQMHIFYFAPYLVLVLYKHTRFASLWRAIGCGVIIDLFSSAPTFGLTALNYSIVCWVLYGQTRNFFEDKPMTLPLMTFFFSVLSTLTSAVLFLFFTTPVALSFKWLYTDLIGMSLLVDGGYALLLSIPFQITYKLRRIIRAKRRAR